MAFSSRARIFGRIIYFEIHSPPEFFFFLSGDQAYPHYFHSLGQDQSTVAQRDCGRVFPDELRVISFPDRFPYDACAAA